MKLPKAYETGYQDFYGRDFLVTKDTLIPRPETEQLIDEVLSLAGKPFLPGVKPSSRTLPTNPIIIDVGTGSGCIAITIKKELPETIVYAVDISEKALKVAKDNAKAHKVNIEFRKSNLLENTEDIKPNLIIANLPYVDESWEWLDKEALSVEPSLALYAGDHGLALIKKLIDTANSKYIILEADPCQHKDIVKYASKRGFSLKETRGFALTLQSTSQE